MNATASVPAVVDASSTGLLEWLSSPAAPPVLLGLWARALGLILAWACGILVHQVTALAGSRGIQPAQTRIHRIRADFSWFARFYRFPSVLHMFGSLSPSAFDLVLQLGLVVGSLSGVAAALGVVDSRLALAVCWVIYLSYTSMVQMLIYPWDYVLLEASFISLFLPALQPLWMSWSLSAAPLPVVSWSLRWLLFRLMIGFGRIKFQGASTKEFSYLKGFMVNQPLPNFVGWILYSMPLWVHKLGLVAFFVSEIIVPFGFVFASGGLRVACAVVTVILQLHIQLAGNFGFFNLLSALLCLPSMDGASLLFSQLSWTDAAAAPLTHLVLGATLGPLSLFYLVFNSWCTMTFMHWPSINLPVTRVGAFLRLISPWHIIHSYGIFFANSSPGVRWVPIIEGTDQDVDAMSPEQAAAVRWEQYNYFYFQSSPYTRPPFVAPFHYRLDQSIFYDAIGMVPDTLFASLSSGNPYDYHGENRTNLQRVCQALLLDQAPGSPIERLFAHNPFPSQSRPVRALRISLYLYQPTSWRDGSSATTGGRTKYWNVKYVGSQVPGAHMTRRSLLAQVVAPYNKQHMSLALAAAKQPSSTVSSAKAKEEEHALGRRFYRLHEPSEWHPDLLLWQRCTTLHARLTSRLDAQLARATDTKVDLDAAVDLASDYAQDFEPGVYARFWNDFMPRVRALHRRIAASAQCALSMTASDHAPASGPCRCPCQSCRFRNEWARLHADADGGDSSPPQQPQPPVLDWSAEVTSLRTSLFHGRDSFTPSDLFFFQLLIQRLVMLLQHRVQGEAGKGVYHGPGPDESRRESEESEARQRGALERDQVAQGACADLCGCAGSVGGAAGGGVTRLPAPTLEACFGLLPPPIGARASCTSSVHLHLPSFFHLHLFLTHALLSCESRASFSSMLASPPAALLALAPSFSLGTGLLALGIFQRDLLAFHASKARLARCITFPQQREQGGLLPGFLQVSFDFLPFQFWPRDERGRPTHEHLPTDVRRPQKSDEYWRVNMDDLPDPTVDLD